MFIVTSPLTRNCPPTGTVKVRPVPITYEPKIVHTEPVQEHVTPSARSKGQKSVGKPGVLLEGTVVGPRVELVDKAELESLVLGIVDEDPELVDKAELVVVAGSVVVSVVASLVLNVVAGVVAIVDSVVAVVLNVVVGVVAIVDSVLAVVGAVVDSAAVVVALAVVDSMVLAVVATRADR